MNYCIGFDTSGNLYTFDYVNCFEKPLGLILCNEDEKFQSFFYIYLKLFQSYSIREFDSPEIFYTVGFNNALTYIIGRKLGFKVLINEADATNIHLIIRQYIDDGYPALVPGNLRELSYSEHYQTSDWKHLFLVNGYNEEKKTYSVIDRRDEEKSDFLRYDEVSFSYELIERLNTSAREKLNVSSVWSIYRKEETENPEELELLNDILDLYLNHRMEQPYKELDYIHRINKEIEGGSVDNTDEVSDPTTQIDFIFLRSVKYKDTFYSELINVLRKYPINQELIARLDYLRTELYKKWTSIMNNSLVHRYLKQRTDLKSELIQVQKQEEETRQLVHLIKAELL